MSREQILRVVAQNVLKVLPDVTEEMVLKASQLSDLGANSLDRVDIVVGSMTDLGLQVPVTELGRAKDIDTLVSLLERHRSERV